MTFLQLEAKAAKKVMVGDIKVTFSQWINHIRDNKGKRPENGQNRRDLGGAKKIRRTLGGGEKKFFLVEFNIWCLKLHHRYPHYPHKNISHTTTNKSQP